MTTRLAAALVAIGGFAIRFLRLGAIENDHYVYLARAHQMLHGDWPVRDFADPGMPLGYLLSAVAAWVAGPTLLTEAVLSIALFTIGLVGTMVLARRASGSVLIGLMVAAVVLLFPPRLYNSSKMLVPVIGMVIAWAYADRPSTGRALVLGGWIGVAFLFRHDYAIYVGIAAMALLAVCHWRERTVLFTRLVTCFAIALTVAVPWLLYVQAEQGLPEYLASAARFSLAERTRTVSHWPPVYFAFAAGPLIVLITCARGTRQLATSHVLFAGLLVFLADLVLLRDQPGSRLPDVYAVTAVMGAIVAGRFVPSARRDPDRRANALSIVAPVTLVAGLTIAFVTAAATGIPGLSTIASRWALVASRLREARPEIMPDPARAALVGYLARCTPADERILVGGFGPELSVFAQRAFAGGLPDWVRGYYEDAADVERARRQLARERVAVAIMLDGGAAFTASWPAVAGDLHKLGLNQYFLQLPDSRVELWTRPSPRTDPPSGLPCR